MGSFCSRAQSSTDVLVPQPKSAPIPASTGKSTIPTTTSDNFIDVKPIRIRTAARRPHPRGEDENENLETNVVVWLDADIDKTKDSAKTKQKLRDTVNYLKTFTDPAVCKKYMLSIKKEKIYLIVSGSLGKDLVPDIHDKPQIENVYVFCSNVPKNKEWSDNYPKVRIVTSDINSICEKFKTDTTKLAAADEIAIVSIPRRTGVDEPNRQEASFMFFQLLIEILLRMEASGDKERFIAICRKLYNDNEKELQNIEDFAQNYSPAEAIKWYTRDTFLYRILNHALRVQSVVLLFQMKFFIQDIHNHLKLLHTYEKKQSSMLLYRGQAMDNNEFNRLQQNIGGFLSINSFLSTSLRRNIALHFALQSSVDRADVTPILFEMKVDTKKSPKPFHNISQYSAFETEQEILFSVGTVFHIESVQKMKDGVWVVKLILDGEEDKELKELTELLRKEIHASNDLFTLGKLTYRMGEYEFSEQLYSSVVENLSENHPDRASALSNLGSLLMRKGSHSEALDCYNKCLKWELAHSPLNFLAHAATYHNIGTAYAHLDDNEKALSYFEKAKKIEEELLPSNTTSIASTYNQMAAVYRDMGDFQNALLYAEKALSIQQTSLPKNHLEKAMSLENLGLIYEKQGDVQKGLEYFLKSLQMETIVLPALHPTLIHSHCNIGQTYLNLGNYPEALKHFKTSYDIASAIDHPLQQPLQTLILLSFTQMAGINIAELLSSAEE